MLQYEIAKKLYEEIKEKAASCPIEGFDEFYNDFLSDAAEYAKTRTAWAFMSREERQSSDSTRTATHDGYMAMLEAVCRNLEIKGIDELLPDRKTKGDFACYVALFLAMEQR